MKKAIISSILSVGCIGAVVTSAVFLPAVVANSGYSPSVFDFSAAINQATTNNSDFNLRPQYLNALNISLKELILGTKAINNGNYVIYIGSEGYANNRGFLYNQTNLNNFENDMTRPLDKSEFGNGLQFLNSSDFRNNPKATMPTIITFIDKLTPNDFVNRDKYNALVKSYKELTITNDQKPEGEKLTEQQLAENKKKYDWAQGAPSFDFSPGASYKDWQGKKQYYRDSYESGIKFNEIYNFVAANFKGLQQASSSQGTVLGYVNGNYALHQQFNGSFTAVTEEQPQQQTETSSAKISSASLLKAFKPATIFNTAFANWLKALFIKI